MKKQLLSENYEHPFRWDPQSVIEFIPVDLIAKYTEVLDKNSVFDKDFELN